MVPASLCRTPTLMPDHTFDPLEGLGACIRRALRRQVHGRYLGPRATSSGIEGIVPVPLIRPIRSLIANIHRQSLPIFTPKSGCSGWNPAFKIGGLRDVAKTHSKQ